MKQKIIIRVLGGIGNQLFIYAFARLLSLENKDIVVKLETRTGFRNDYYNRSYKLDRFNTQLQKATFFESLFFKIERKYPFLRKLLFKQTKLYIEDEQSKISSTQKVFDLTNIYSVIYCQGYWQYIDFNAIRALLKEELQISLLGNKRFIELEKKINTVESVAIHVRRVQYSGLLEGEYYFKNMTKIISSVKKPIFFVFSDDIEWCKETFKTFECVFVENFEDELYELKLISLCKYFVIANSTFSWWGAWLSSHEEKKVYMPEGYLECNMDCICF